MAGGSVQVRESLAVFISVLLLTSTGVVDRWLAGPPEADDASLVAEIRNRLVPPTPASVPYGLGYPDLDYWGQSEQVKYIQALTRNKTGGFFIETGAHDGESMSNSLLLERKFGWQGVLIEPSRELYGRLRLRNRRAWTLEACASHTGVPFQAMLRDQLKFGLNTVEDGLVSQLLSDQARKSLAPTQGIHKYWVKCYPLYSVLLALNRTSVDFFSLDVEGTEMGILAYMPWHLVDIKILLVENFLSYFWNPQTDLMRWLMESHGYLAMRLQHDWLFVRRDCEYAKDAEDIIRRLRHQIAVSKENKVTDPFND
ncbi:uncharacterized protein LOC119095626 [Pollicipes pollicipes]|uniref:uncharacterized protein LOC119095626 n=1 Tax=Pollicipes pollicipes TaxID=41117 RepID=UPI001884F0E3|nr:uncharacterized protein LOC119095626 [Pollicipes pollicipes]